MQVQAQEACAAPHAAARQQRRQHARHGRHAAGEPGGHQPDKPDGGLTTPLSDQASPALQACPACVQRGGGSASLPPPLAPRRALFFACPAASCLSRRKQQPAPYAGCPLLCTGFTGWHVACRPSSGWHATCSTCCFAARNHVPLHTFHTLAAPPVSLMIAAVPAVPHTSDPDPPPILTLLPARAAAVAFLPLRPRSFAPAAAPCTLLVSSLQTVRATCLCEENTAAKGLGGGGCQAGGYIWGRPAGRAGR